MSTSSIPLWGRAYKLSVRLASGNMEILTQSSWEPEALRIAFDVLETTLPSPYWFADIVIYNLNKPEVQNLLWNAQWVTLEAGYQNGDSKYSIIWDGPVMQVLYARENVVDTTIRFNCMAGPWLLESQFINQSSGPMSSQLQIVSGMIEQGGGVPKSQISEFASQMLAAKQLPRGKTTFGSVSKYISDMADDNYLNNWIQQNNQYISELSSPTANLTPKIIFGPPVPPGYTAQASDVSVTRSIIGVPKQSTFGCIFTVLLDPRLKVGLPPIVVKLDQTLIQQLKIQYGQVITPLDKDGLYVVGQVRHFGDSRGNEWYTEVTGYTPGYAQGLLSGTFTASQAGVQ